MLAMDGPHAPTVLIRPDLKRVEMVRLDGFLDRRCIACSQ